MKKTTMISVAATTVFYMLCGCMGYAAFGDLSPGNLLTGFGFYNPYRLLDIASVGIVVHLVGGYQVFCQPFFAFVEKAAAEKYAVNTSLTKHIKVHDPFFGHFSLNLFRLVWRTAFVIMTTVVSMLLFFNDVAELLGAYGIWPLTVYFPIQMYIAEKTIPKWSKKWICLQIISLACLLITAASAAVNLKSYRPFNTSY